MVTGGVLAQVPQDTVLNAYTGQTEITAKRRITLKSGFRIPAGKKVRIYTGASFGKWVTISSKPSTDQNYILTRIFKKPGIKDDAAASSNAYNTGEVRSYYKHHVIYKNVPLADPLFSDRFWHCILVIILHCIPTEYV
ncbi:hypothetical protein TH53_22120 [Pedobacter lusitanus]|uniref:Uncharacterized protein n=1 Tax=Pedobacter lusitanus TaxID=1503925 RepID=A0A0D0FRX1_9SPHI|nr:hypothetical protein TH53_22120 [Pedobacter lusitanus]